ncbi:MAG: peptidylprolyl isomerase, partial [Lachnospiraceae bacterium]|nr:peptidylprolyl isomerase [Lachnospiraceae bacterium]
MSFLLCLCACGKNDAKTELITPSPTEAGTNDDASGIPPLPEGEQIYAHIDVQDYGSITVLLRPDCAPITVDNFVKIAESGFYDGLTFHRIISGFMIQGG